MLPILKDYSVLNLKEFLLTESFSLSETHYGSDLSDETFIEDSTSYYTFFKFEDLYVLVMYNKNTGEFGYGMSDTFSTNINLYTDMLSAFTTKQFLKLLNNIFFIFSQLIDKYKSIVYVFIAMPTKMKLDELYSNIFNTISFQRVISLLHFKYKKESISSSIHEYRFMKFKSLV